jgi:hypothetical protein
MSVQSLQDEVNRLYRELEALNVAGERISVGNYLLARLAQLGVEASFTSV